MVQHAELSAARTRDLLADRASDPRPALVEGATGRSLTWIALAERARHWECPPASLPPAQRVGMLFSDPLDMAAAYLGAVAHGYTVAPLDPLGAGPELVGQARALGLASVITAPGDAGSLRAALRAAGVDLWVAGAEGIEPAGAKTAAGHAEPGRGAALVLASSGTTGRPKLIPLTEAQLLHTARAVVANHGLGPADCGYSPLPLFHINGLVVGVLSALVGGYRLVVDRKFSASAFWGVVAREEVTWLNLVPAIINVLGSRPAPPPEVAARVAFARSASAPLSVAHLRQFEDVTGIPVVETYGMTEAASQIAANPRPPLECRPGSVGFPVALDARVVDKQRRPVPAETVGQIEIRGDNVVSTYWAPAGEPQAERPARAEDGWLPTGDLGRFDADGYLYLAGRCDDVINRGGEKVYPREVEEVLVSDPDVQAAAVVGRPHPTVGEEPVALVLAAGGVDPDALRSRLVDRCNEQLSRFRRPAEIVLVDSLPVGPNGKIRHAEIRRRLNGHHSDAVAPAAQGHRSPAASAGPSSAWGADG